MSRYLIEVPHDPNALACTRVVQVFLGSGSHFLTHADWGCLDGEHSAWFVADVDSREEARSIVPPPFRRDARIVRLSRFSLEQVDHLMRAHEDHLLPRQPTEGDLPAGPADTGICNR